MITQLNLINKINKFYNIAAQTYLNIKYSQQGYHMPDDEDDSLNSGEPSGDLLEQADQIVPNDPGLSAEFTNFINTYMDLCEAFEVNPNNISREGLDKVTGLIETLSTKAKRLVSNSKLDDPNFAQKEDFNPADFTTLIQNIVKDADDRLALLAGEDIEEIKATTNQYTQEFNELQERSEEGKREQYSAQKVENARIAAKRHYQEQKAKKILNPNDPVWQQIAEKRRKYYAMQMQEMKTKFPEEYEKYKANQRERQKNFQENPYQSSKRKLIDAISEEPDPIIKDKLKKRLLEIEDKIKNKSQKDTQYRKEKAVQRKQILQAGNLGSGIKKLKENIANVKMGIKKKVTADISFQEDAQFKPYKDAIAAAHSRGDSASVLKHTKSLQKALNDAAVSHPLIVAYEENVKPYSQFRTILENIDKTGWMDKDISDDETARQQIQWAADYGKWTLGHQNVSKSIIETTSNIVKQLLNKLGNV